MTEENETNHLFMAHYELSEMARGVGVVWLINSCCSSKNSMK